MAKTVECIHSMDKLWNVYIPWLNCGMYTFNGFRCWKYTFHGASHGIWMRYSNVTQIETSMYYREHEFICWFGTPFVDHESNICAIILLIPRCPCWTWCSLILEYSSSLKVKYKIGSSSGFLSFTNFSTSPILSTSNRLGLLALYCSTDFLPSLLLACFTRSNC